MNYQEMNDQERLIFILTHSNTESICKKGINFIKKHKTIEELYDQCRYVTYLDMGIYILFMEINNPKYIKYFPEVKKIRNILNTFFYNNSTERIILKEYKLFFERLWPTLIQDIQTLIEIYKPTRRQMANKNQWDY